MGAWSARWLAVGVSLILAGACSGKSSFSGRHGKGKTGHGGSAGNTGGTGKGGAGTSGAAGTLGGEGGEGGEGAEECTGPAVGLPTRVVRLSFTQVRNALSDLIGEDAATTIAAEESLPSAADRWFPPLDGDSVIEATNFATGDRVGQAVGRYLLENFEAVTDCGATPTDVCGERFVEAFAEKAARRPLTSIERENFVTVFAECKSFGGTVQEAVQYGVYAVIDSPLFLYRFELGDLGSTEEEVSLEPYELASLLSFFVTDAPPDADLLAAAEDGSIAQPAVLGEHALRLFGTPRARENFDTAMAAHFDLPSIPSIVVDPNIAPGFTESLRAAMLREGELFLDDALFGGRPLAELLSSRRSFANAELAALYGIDGFPNGAALDDRGFASVALPEVRAGLLTMPGFLLAHQAPTNVRIVDRGGMVRRLIACDPPTYPDDHPDLELPPQGTELERARERTSNSECSSCHSNFELYGIPLYAFDGIGRYRTEDENGNALDVSVTLPARAGGAHVKNAAEMAVELAKPEIFGACIAKSLIAFALGEQIEAAPIDRTACAVRDIERAFAEGDDPSFGGIVREVARSPVLTRRIAAP